MWYLEEIEDEDGSLAMTTVYRARSIKDVKLTFSNDDDERISLSLCNELENKEEIGVEEYLKEKLGDFYGIMDDLLIVMPKRYKFIYENMRFKDLKLLEEYKNRGVSWTKNFIFITHCIEDDDIKDTNSMATLWDILLKHPELYSVSGNTLTLIVNRNTMNYHGLALEYFVPSDFMHNLLKVKILEV
jgi:hypothetical protein